MAELHAVNTNESAALEWCVRVRPNTQNHEKQPHNEPLSLLPMFPQQGGHPQSAGGIT